MIIIIAKTLEIIAVAFIYGIILMVLARSILSSMGFSSRNKNRNDNLAYFILI
jgi:hypothetical protein